MINLNKINEICESIPDIVKAFLFCSAISIFWVIILG